MCDCLFFSQVRSNFFFTWLSLTSHLYMSGSLEDGGGCGAGALSLKARPPRFSP